MFGRPSDNGGTLNIQRFCIFKKGILILARNLQDGKVFPLRAEKHFIFPFIPVNDGTNPSIFPVAFKNANLEVLYSGTLQWLVDNSVMLSSYPLEKFKKVPETQGAFLLDGEGAAVQLGRQVQWDLNDLTELIIPRMTIAGTRDHKITVNFDASNLTFECTDGYTPYLVFIMTGFLVKGGCEYKGGKNPFGDVVGNW